MRRSKNFLRSTPYNARLISRIDLYVRCTTKNEPCRISTPGPPHKYTRPCNTLPDARRPCTRQHRPTPTLCTRKKKKRWNIFVHNTSRDDNASETWREKQGKGVMKSYRWLDYKNRTSVTSLLLFLNTSIPVQNLGGGGGREERESRQPGITRGNYGSCATRGHDINLNIGAGDACVQPISTTATGRTAATATSATCPAQHKPIEPETRFQQKRTNTHVKTVGKVSRSVAAMHPPPQNRNQSRCQSVCAPTEGGT